METFLSMLESGRIIVADGAMGTMLQAAGLPVGMAPEAWLLENPDAVVGVHRAYVEAGAELILTCTFGGNRVRLERSGLSARVAEVNRRAVEIARRAADGRAWVAGDIGPLGELLAPLGKLTYEKAVTIFAEQARALAEAGVDLLYIETMADLNEARAAVEGARQADDRIPITVTLSFDKHGRTNMGVRPEQAAEALLKMGVAAIGANCGYSLEVTLQALEKMHAHAPQVALIAKPNAGLPRMVERREVYDATPELMADYVLKYVAAGARIVGGCCGSTPEHIRAIARAVK